MKKPTIAVISFPGNNGEIESLRTFWRCGFDAFVFRWNDSREKLAEVDGYFFGAGFSYEDRGRAGMVAARDSLFNFLSEEAQRGKVLVGCCNGAQMLVESGLIPLDYGLRMSLARNVIEEDGEQVAPGFLNEWIYITPSCSKDRCATSNWEGVMHIPIAHGEGRFTTKDADVIDELKKNDQLAFSYCDADGNISMDPSVNPNGSMFAAAGICNPAGNVIALMPHPERTTDGYSYFLSMKEWIETKGIAAKAQKSPPEEIELVTLPENKTENVEIFIDTIIVNNEERTVEQAARRLIPELKLIQLRYLSVKDRTPEEVLSTISLFNPNKEVAYIRRGGKVTHWNSGARKEETIDHTPLDEGIKLLRRDDPDTGAVSLGKGCKTGICYVCATKDEQKLCSKNVLEIFANPHASTLEKLV